MPSAGESSLLFAVSSWTVGSGVTPDRWHPHSQPSSQDSGSDRRIAGYFSCQRKWCPIEKEDGMPVWAWVLIIVLLVLLLTGGVYVRR
jgi:cobalamin biosynthesis Mg chelatase CobN